MPLRKLLSCGRKGSCIIQDKAIKRFMVKNIVEASAKKDISDAEVFEGLLMPKIFNKVYYCVACAIHNRIVRVRSRDDRKFRNETKIRMTVDLLQG